MNSLQGLDVEQSPNAQDAFRPMPGLLSFAGVTGSVGVLRHARITQTCTSGHTRACVHIRHTSGMSIVRCYLHICVGRVDRNYICCVCVCVWVTDVEQLRPVCLSSVLLANTTGQDTGTHRPLRSLAALQHVYTCMYA